MPTAAADIGRREFPALGGLAVVLTADAAAAGSAERAVRTEVAAIDAACSRFRADSELAAVNAAAGRPVAVGPLFAEALRAALRAAELTGGAVDPTCGAALAALGYDRDFPLLSDHAPAVRLTGTAPAPGWRTVRWDPEHRRVRIPPGSALDFGATAKALAADRAARAAAEAAGCGVLVSLSGDIATSGPAPDGGWRVRVADDHRAGDGAAGQTVTLTSGGLATSGTTVRTWHVRTAAGPDPAVVHHILDPATGHPAEVVWRTVSAAAATCLDANIATTAAIVKGTAAPRWLRAQRLPARLVRPDGSVLVLGGWPDDEPAAAHPVPGLPGTSDSDAADLSGAWSPWAGSRT
jgi:thiamine biosynthesis lipoprotein